MQRFYVRCPPLRWIGYILIALGLMTDVLAGALLLAGHNLQVLLLHIVAASTWVVGINIVSNSSEAHTSTSRFGLVRLNRQSATALCLSLLPFPGFATLAYTIALIFARCFKQQAMEEILETQKPARSVSLPLNVEVQPLIDILSASDLEMKRAAVTVLSQQAKPESISVLRQLLSDTQAELRSDASIALTRLEEKLARVLNDALAQWVASPHDKERMLHLAEQYYAYACSNVLDEESQQSYLIKAHALVQQCLEQDDTNAQLWMQRARIRRRLGQMAEALTDIHHAIELEPDVPEAYLFAMEVAFDQHSWDMLLALAQMGLSALPSTSEVRTSLQDWVTLYAEPRKGVLHDALC